MAGGGLLSRANKTCHPAVTAAISGVAAVLVGRAGDRRPAAVGPGPVPSAALGQRLRHRIVAMRAPGPAAADAGQAHPAAGPEAEPPDGVAGVFAAAGRVPAGPAGEHRQRIAVALD